MDTFTKYKFPSSVSMNCIYQKKNFNIFIEKPKLFDPFQSCGCIKEDMSYKQLELKAKLAEKKDELSSIRLEFVEMKKSQLDLESKLNEVNCNIQKYEEFKCLIPKSKSEGYIESHMRDFDRLKKEKTPFGKKANSSQKRKRSFLKSIISVD